MELNSLELVLNRTIWGFLFTRSYSCRIYNKELILLLKGNTKIVYILDSKTATVYYYDDGNLESCLLTLDFSLCSIFKTIYQIENLKNLEKMGNILNNLEK